MYFITKIRYLLYIFGISISLCFHSYAEDIPVTKVVFELWFNNSSVISKWHATFTPNADSPLIIPFSDTLNQCELGLTLVNGSGETVLTVTDSDRVSLAPGRFIVSRDRDDPLLFWQLQNKIASTNLPQFIFISSFYSTSETAFSRLYVSGYRNVTGTITPGTIYQGSISLRINSVLQTSQGTFSIVNARFIP